MTAIAQRIANEEPAGRVVAVHGSVVDIRFPPGCLPAIREAVMIEWDLGRPLIAEVQQHLDAVTVRAVALENTAGLNRGTATRATGAPVYVPVGEAVLGRLLNAIGEPADRGQNFPPTSSVGRSMPRHRESKGSAERLRFFTPASRSSTSWRRS